MNQLTRDIRSKLTEGRRRRSLLNKAYRAARRAGRKAYKYGNERAADHFIKAEKIRTLASDQGLVVGGIQSYHRQQDLAKLAVEDDYKREAALLGQQPNSTLQPVAQPATVNQSPTRPLSVEEEDDQQAATPYYDKYGYRPETIK